MKTTITTILYITNGDKVLLAEKKRGFGVGKVNGVGGKVEANETVEEAMIREAYEEIGVKPMNAKLFAKLDFDEYVKEEREKIISYVYVASEYEGEIIESEEMKPSWYDIDNLPFDKMFADDRYWLPLVLAGKKVNGYFSFGKEFKLLDYRIEEVKQIIID